MKEIFVSIDEYQSNYLKVSMLLESQLLVAPIMIWLSI